MRRVLAGLICVLSIEMMTAANAASAQTTTCQGRSIQTAMPANISVAEFMQPVVARLLAQSDTFRRQCARVAASPFVRIHIELMSVRSSFVRARARISRTPDGHIAAMIEVPICRDAPELIVHEMEHVLEQMDGLDLAALARARKTDVRQGADGAFETDRARRAGETAVAELRATSEEDTAVRSPGRRRSWLGLIK
jgi:hypothetical protein